MRSVAIVTALILSVTAALAQGPDSENGRYTFKDIDGGLLRLDSRTGAVSLCAKRASGWACEAVPDERAALETEIARLQRELGTLKQDMLARGLPLPGGVATLPPTERQRELNLRVPLPSDAELDRAMNALEKVWKRLIDMVQRTPGSDRI